MEKNLGYLENIGFFKIMYLNMELKIDVFFFFDRNLRSVLYFLEMFIMCFSVWFNIFFERLFSYDIL